MKHLTLSELELESKGAIHTAREIAQQPEIWSDIFEKMQRERNKIFGFYNEAVSNCKRIILTGAGTSAFIGYSLEGAFHRHSGVSTISMATTHLVTHPMDYFQAEVPTLLVSFARSGNSPESVAAVKMADSCVDNIYHLIITCDEEGQLAKFETKGKKCTFVLPKRSNDRSLAMTSSYTGMLLTGLLVSRLEELESLEEQIKLLCNYGSSVIGKYTDVIKKLSSYDFERAVFLGSGPLYGTATESHLKVQELTDGKVICKNDSFLGFRHGPKAVVDNKTIVFFIFSNKNYVQQYERDLAKSMQNEKTALLLVGVSEAPIEDVSLDVEICCSDSNMKLEEEFLAVCNILPAQILGFFKSLDCGLNPDTPSKSGAINRVVQGVTIYDN